MVSAMRFERLGFGNPLPDRLWEEPSNNGETSILAASKVQSQYLCGDSLLVFGMLVYRRFAKELHTVESHDSRTRP